MHKESLEVTIFNNFKATKKRLKELALSYYADPFLNNVVFIEITKDTKIVLESFNNINLKKTSYAIQTFMINP